MPILVLDAGGVSRLVERSARAKDLLKGLPQKNLWPPLVPSPVLVECLTGRATDAFVYRLLQACQIEEHIPSALARRAATLRFQAGRGSAIDALVVACAEPNGVVLTSDLGDLRALAAQARDVIVERA
jgi:hypothetical protein